MSRADVETVRRMFAAFAKRDVEGTLSLLDPAVEFTAPTTAELAGRTGPYRGHEGIRQYFRDVATIWDDLLVEPADVRAVAGAVVIFGQVQGRRGGEVLAVNVVWTWRLRAGRVVSGSVFPTPEPRAGEGGRAQSGSQPPRPPAD